MRPQDDLLANRYELTSLIAGGGMGQVWRGRDVLLDRPVAVKVLREQLAGDPSFLARFRAEARHAAVLTHPHITAVFDYGEVPAENGGAPRAYLVMELVEGESLADLLARERRLDPARTVGIVRQAADGLAAAHAAGVVHRDVKPANLLVTPQGVVKITDFGIARSASSVAVTATGQVMGTVHYFSPEQAAGGQATPASDVYALGAVAYECLAGRRPFEAESPVQIAVMHIRENPAPLAPGIPPGVRALVERAMAKDPAARFPHGAALRDAAARTSAGLRSASSLPAATAVLPAVGPDAAPIGLTSGELRRPRRWTVPVLAGLAVLLLAVGVLAALLPGGSDAPTTGSAPATGSAPPASTAPSGIELVAEEHIGRSVRDVQAALIGRGLRVELTAVEAADVPAGQVTAVEPAGTLASGDVVRLSYAVPPPPATTAPTTVPAPAPVDQGSGDVSGDDGEDEETSAEDGKGKDKGKGKEKNGGD